MGAIAALAASGSASESVELTAPPTPGRYYYGACVDSVTDETDTTNNCSTSVQVSTLQPDLVMGSPPVSKSGPAVGAQFTLSAAVRNDGEGAAVSTTLRYYPIDGRDDHDVRHAGGHGRGGTADGIGKQQPVGGCDGAGDRGDVLLRSVRGRGDGRVGHDEQLLDFGGGDRTGCGTARTERGD